MVACMNGNYPVVNYLVKEGVRTDVESIDGKTARNFAEEAFIEN
jgi:ankyrin repeat protein